MAGLGLALEEDVEVYSFSEHAWFPGQVWDVLDEVTEIGGVVFAEGSIKVKYEVPGKGTQMKWLQLPIRKPDWEGRGGRSRRRGRFAARQDLRPGDRVEHRRNDALGIGRIVDISGDEVQVDFPENSDWAGTLADVRRAPSQVFRVGDQVCHRRFLDFGTGEVTNISGFDVEVDFPHSPDWVGDVSELKPGLARGLCKWRCGRCVQPGMFRNGQPYDTCCRACATSGGGPHKHDDNCGGTGADAAGEAIADVPSPKAYLDDLIDSDEQLRQVAEGIIEILPSQAGRVSGAEAWNAIQDYLLADVNHSLSIPEEKRGELTREVTGAGPDARLSLDMFVRLCREAALWQRTHWFPANLKVKTKNFVQRNPWDVTGVYDSGEPLGRGSFGEVYEVKHRVSKEIRACKKIQKRRGREGVRVSVILMEIDFMARLDHPGVIRVYESFEDRDFIFQILEKGRGGNLEEKVASHFDKTRAALPEVFMNDVMMQVLRALAFMHGQHGQRQEPIIHKDLKCENIMIMEEMREGQLKASVKVVDFGLSELLEEGQESAEYGGTLLYMAPELFNDQPVRFKCDIWSAGVVLYHMITNFYPFVGEGPWETPAEKREWRRRTVPLVVSEDRRMLQHRNLDRISSGCRQALEAMLRKDQNQRPNAGGAEGVLSMSWFNSPDEQLAPLSVGNLQCLQAYAEMPNLKKVFFLYLAHSDSSSTNLLEELRAIFTHFDKDNTGSLPVDTLRQVLLRSRLPPVATDRVLFALDRDGSGWVQWTEFTAAALCFVNSKKKAMIEATFKTIDRDEDGSLYPQDFVDAFAGDEDRDDWSRDIEAECDAVFRQPPPYSLELVTHVMMERLHFVSGDRLLGAV